MSINDLPQPILEEYNKIMSRFTDEARLEQFNNLRKFVEEKTQYLVTPASTRYHMCCKHGLVLHSMSVTDTFFKIRDGLGLQNEISDSQIVLLGMFHDLGKVGASMNQPLYIVNEPTEKQKQYGYPANPPYLFNKDILYLEHCDRSLYLITKFMSISAEEYQAPNGESPRDTKTGCRCNRHVSAQFQQGHQRSRQQAFHPGADL